MTFDLMCNFAQGWLFFLLLLRLSLHVGFDLRGHPRLLRLPSNFDEESIPFFMYGLLKGCVRSKERIQTSDVMITSTSLPLTWRRCLVDGDVVGRVDELRPVVVHIHHVYFYREIRGLLEQGTHACTMMIYDGLMGVMYTMCA